MALVTVTINGYAHTVGCEDGQESHLIAMAAAVDQRVQSIKAVGGQSGEARLLALAALMMADELHDLNLYLDSAQMPPPVVPIPPDPRSRDAQLGRRLGKLAERAEEIALNLEHP